MLSAAQRALGRAFGVDRSELGRVVPLTLAYGCVLASIYVLKPARNALFLAELGIGQIPYVLLLVAAVGGGFAVGYGRLTQGLAVDSLVQRTFLGLMGLLGGFWLLLDGQPPGWVYYAFYVWVALYGLLTTSLMWLVAGGIFDPREARRVFGLIGTGGIGGAIVGGWFTGAAAEALGAENLLPVAIGLLLLSLVLLRLLPPTREAVAPPRSVSPEATGIGSVARSPLLANLALATGIIAAVAVIVDVQFNAVVDQTFPAQDEKAAFFGAFFAGLSGFSFFFQLLVTPLVLRWLGVGAALAILPAALGVGSLGLLLVPGLLSGIAAKSADGGFRHSVHKAASEVLFLPIPADLKKRSKLFLDTTVDTTATGLGALAVLLLTEQLGFSYPALSVVSVTLLVGALVVIRRVRAAYVDAFRQALERRRIDLDQVQTSLAEAGAFELLKPALRSGQPRQVVYALDLLAGLRRKALVEELDRLLDHPSPEVRRRALALRVDQDEPLPSERLEAALDDPDLGVGTDALVLLVRNHAEVGHRVLLEALTDEDGRRRAAALRALAELGPALAEDQLKPERLAAWLEDLDFRPARPDLARVLARIGQPSFDPVLERLLEEGDRAVSRAVIEGIGAGRNDRWLAWLFEQLHDPALRSAIRAALAGFGAEAVPPVAARLGDRATDPSVRRALVRVLGRIPTQSSVDVLLSQVDDPDPMVARSARRALLKLRLGFGGLRFRRRKVRAAVEAAARRHHQAGRYLSALDGPGPHRPAVHLILRTLREGRDEERNAVLDLLALRTAPTDIERVRSGLRRDRGARERASALELLENVVEAPCRAAALAVLDDVDAEAQQRRGQALFGGDDLGPDEALARLLEHGSAWLRACAVHAAAERDDPELVRRAEAARADPSVFVREAAHRAVSASADRAAAVEPARPSALEAP